MKNVSYSELLGKYVETHDMPHTPSFSREKTQSESYLRFHLQPKTQNGPIYSRRAASTQRIILTNNEDWNFDSFALSAFH